MTWNERLDGIATKSVNNSSYDPESYNEEVDVNLWEDLHPDEPDPIEDDGTGGPVHAHAFLVIATPRQFNTDWNDTRSIAEVVLINHDGKRRWFDAGDESWGYIGTDKDLIEFFAEQLEAWHDNFPFSFTKGCRPLEGVRS